MDNICQERYLRACCKSSSLVPKKGLYFLSHLPQAWHSIGIWFSFRLCMWSSVHRHWWPPWCWPYCLDLFRHDIAFGRIFVKDLLYCLIQVIQIHENCYMYLSSTTKSDYSIQIKRPGHIMLHKQCSLFS